MKWCSKFMSRGSKVPARGRAPACISHYLCTMASSWPAFLTFLKVGVASAVRMKIPVSTSKIETIRSAGRRARRMYAISDPSSRSQLTVHRNTQEMVGRSPESPSANRRNGGRRLRSPPSLCEAMGGRKVRAPNVLWGTAQCANTP